MKYEIKQLSQNAKIFFPQTSAEAVVVKHNGLIVTLDKALDKKIETVITSDNSGLGSTTSGQSVTIYHLNNITPNGTQQALKIQYDQNGHIVSSSELAKHSIIVNQLPYVLYNGNADSTVNFSDSFKIDDNKIELNWIEK